MTTARTTEEDNPVRKANPHNKRITDRNKNGFKNRHLIHKGDRTNSNRAEYAVTQLFYDNRKYFEFVEQAKAAGINIPIIPGIKPFKKLSQLSMIPKTFKVDLPEDLVKEALKCKNDAEAEQVGIEWCVAQCKELMAHGVPSIHFYSIGAVDSIKEVAKIIY